MAGKTLQYEWVMPPVIVAFWNAFFVILGILFLVWAARTAGVI